MRFVLRALVPISFLATVACNNSAGGAGAQASAGTGVSSVRPSASLTADSARRADSLQADSVRVDSLRADSIRVDSLRADSLRPPKGAAARSETLGRAADALVDTELTRGKGAVRRKFIARHQARHNRRGVAAVSARSPIRSIPRRRTLL